MKNQAKKNELMVRFYKKGYGPKNTLTLNESLEQSLCFGWAWASIKRIDEETYAVRLTKRKPKSAWSHGNIKKVAELKKRGLMHSSGLKAFETRNKALSQEKEPELPAKYIKLFKKNKKAWDFFNSQAPGYRRHAAWWVIQARQKETQERRLAALIADSSEESKLKNFLAAAKKYVKTYEPGQTPIEAAKNIGPVLGAELRSIGLPRMEDLQRIGWEKALYRLTELYPHRINLNAFCAIIGATENQSFKKLDPQLKNNARSLLLQIKSDYR